MSGTDSTCRCGAPLTEVAASTGDEWVWVDSDGRRYGPAIDLAEQGITDPYAALNALAKSGPAEAYAALKVRVEQGGMHHIHRPLTAPPFTTDLVCCGWPMRHRPSGWDCRVHPE